MAVGTEKKNLGKIRWTNNFLLSQRTYNGLKWAKLGAEAWHEWLTPAMLYAFTGEYIFGKAGTMCEKLRREMSVWTNFLKTWHTTWLSSQRT